MREWLTQIRKDKNLTQAQVAEKVGVVPSYINMIEKGQRGSNLKVYTAKKIAKVLDFPWTKFYE
jgi:transcriptional regulator with XRE-family HTH domain